MSKTVEVGIASETAVSSRGVRLPIRDGQKRHADRGVRASLARKETGAVRETRALSRDRAKQGKFRLFKRKQTILTTVAPSPYRSDQTVEVGGVVERCYEPLDNFSLGGRL